MCCAYYSIAPSSLVVDPGAYDLDPISSWSSNQPTRSAYLSGFPVESCAGCVIAYVRFFALTLGHRFEVIHSFSCSLLGLPAGLSCLFETRLGVHSLTTAAPLGLD